MKTVAKNNQIIKNLLILVVVVGSFFFITKTLAVDNPFRPGETRDPACAPGDIFCTVNLDKDLYKENAIGLVQNITSGANSIAIGSGNTASGQSSIAIGHGYDGNPGAKATGARSIAIGSDTEASGKGSTAFGQATAASGEGSAAFGTYSQAKGMFSTAMGVGTVANSMAEMAFGAFNTPSEGNPSSPRPEDPIFVIGNGTDEENTRNAFTVYKSGDVRVGDNKFDNINFVVAGTGSIVLPTGDNSNRPQNNIQPGMLRFSQDNGSVEFYNGLGMGDQCEDGWEEDPNADGLECKWAMIAGGNTDGWYGVMPLEALSGISEIITQLSGYQLIDEKVGKVGINRPIPNGDYSVGVGEGVITQDRGEVAVGQYNRNDDSVGDSVVYSPVNKAFTVGVGEDDNNRASALTIYRNGWTHIGNDPIETLTVFSNLPFFMDGLFDPNLLALTTDGLAYLTKDGQWSDAPLIDGYNVTNISELEGSVMTQGSEANQFITSMLAWILGGDAKLSTFDYSATGRVGYGLFMDQNDYNYDVLSMMDPATLRIVSTLAPLAMMASVGEMLGGLEDFFQGEGFQQMYQAVQMFVEFCQQTECHPDIGDIGGGQEASLIKATNDMNVTNLLLFFVGGLLLVNLMVLVRVNRRK